MKILLTLMFVVLAATGLAMAQPPNESDAVEVTSLLQSRMHVDELSATLVKEGPYIVAFWKAGNGYAAGAALAKKGDAGWTIVSSGTKPLDTAAALQALGVPAAQALALAKDQHPQ